MSKITFGKEDDILTLKYEFESADGVNWIKEKLLEEESIVHIFSSFWFGKDDVIEGLDEEETNDYE